MKTLYYECDICGAGQEEVPEGGDWIMSASDGISLARTADEIEHVCRPCQIRAKELTTQLWLLLRQPPGAIRGELIAALLVELLKTPRVPKFYVAAMTDRISGEDDGP